LDWSNLNLLYSKQYRHEILDVYDWLLLEAIAGEHRLFIRSDELDAGQSSRPCSASSCEAAMLLGKNWRNTAKVYDDAVLGVVLFEIAWIF
jgi:hypothetical protein